MPVPHIDPVPDEKVAKEAAGVVSAVFFCPNPSAATGAAIVDEVKDVVAGFLFRMIGFDSEGALNPPNFTSFTSFERNGLANVGAVSVAFFSSEAVVVGFVAADVKLKTGADVSFLGVTGAGLRKDDEA